MAKLRNLVILLVVLAAACIATILVSGHEIKKEQIKESGETILQIDPDTVTFVSWEHNGSSLTFTKEDTAWTSSDDSTLPVDADKISELLDTFNPLTAGFVIENADNLSQYGLDKPECTITLTASDTDYTIELGGFSTMDQERYLSIGDGNVYLVTTDPLNAFDRELDYFTKTDDIPKLQSADSISFSGTLIAAPYTITYDAENAAAYSDADIYYCDNAAYDSEKITSYLEALSELDLGDCVNHSYTAAEASEYGLDKPALTAEISYDETDDSGKKTGNKLTLSYAVGLDPSSDSSASSSQNTDSSGSESASSYETSESSSVSASDTASKASSKSSASANGDDDTDENVTAYIRFNDSALVYKLSADDYKTVAAAGKGSFCKLALLPVSFDDIDSIEVSLDGESYTFTGTRKLTGGRDWSYNGEAIDISDIRSAAEGAKANDISADEPSLKKEISLKLNSSNKNHPLTSVDIYRYNGKDCIMVGDDGIPKLISRSSVSRLTEAVYAIVLG